MAMDTNRKCLAGLRKLGYAKSPMQMARNAVTYSQGGTLGESRLMITIGKGTDQFIVTDRKGDLTFMSAALSIGNLKNGARAHLMEIVDACVVTGLLKPGTDVNNYELLIAIAELGLITDAEAVA